MKQYVNQYNEALDALTSGMLDTSDIEPYMSDIVEALKKQIPDKPYYRKEEDAEGWACPNCDDGVTVNHGRIRDTYCSHCGQMIDWDAIVTMVDKEE